MRRWSAAGTILPLLAFSLVSSALSQLPLPRFSKLPLLNGMEILVLEDPPPASGSVDVVLMIRNGAAFDPVEKFGATYLLSRLLMEGSERRSGDQLREDLARLGAQLEIRVEWDAIYVLGTAPPDRVEDTLNVLGEIIIQPNSVV